MIRTWCSKNNLHRTSYMYSFVKLTDRRASLYSYTTRCRWCCMHCRVSDPSPRNNDGFVRHTTCALRPPRLLVLVTQATKSSKTPYAYVRIICRCLRLQAPPVGGAGVMRSKRYSCNGSSQPLRVRLRFRRHGRPRAIQLRS